MTEGLRSNSCRAKRSRFSARRSECTLCSSNNKNVLTMRLVFCSEGFGDLSKGVFWLLIFSLKAIYNLVYTDLVDRICFYSAI